jgi:hypothetical protein
MRDLGLVANVAACCIVLVLMFGQYYDALFRVAKVETVECSYQITNMAKKINVTLMGECEVIK